MQDLIPGVTATPLWQQVADGIRRSIQTGRLRPGDRVIEAQLARQLGISRNPIREALRELQQQGILEYYPNVGTIVASLPDTDADLAIEMRNFLEARAARMIVESGELERLRPLEDVVARMGALPAGAPLEQAELLDVEFHTRLIQAAPSALLQHIWASVDPYTWMILVAWQSTSREREIDYQQLYREHRDLLDALQSGDAGRAEAAVLAQLDRLKKLRRGPAPAADPA